jgi:DNA ligase 1
LKAFARLYSALDETTKTSGKVDAMVDYFRAAPPSDAAWAVYFLIGRKPRQVIPSARLRALAAATAGVSDWLFEESYHAVGDLAETIALLLPEPSASSELSLATWVEERLLPLRTASEPDQQRGLLAAWTELDGAQRFVWNKLITGALRLGVSQQLVIRALAKVADLDPATISHRLMGDWEPTPQFYSQLLDPDAAATEISRPYPFFLAHPIERQPTELGQLDGWQAEWKWDGIRAQMIRRKGQTFIWTRGEELVTERYPELASMGGYLPDGTVIDGEILPWKGSKVLPFAQLQRRIGLKAVGKKILAEVPVVLMAFDLLELGGVDIRGLSLAARRAKLVDVMRGLGWDAAVMASPILTAASWDELATIRATSREVGVEGMMLKCKDSPYRVGRVRGDWWKWKISPLSMDAVLIAAQRGSGKRAGLFTDYTFGVWDGEALVTVAKAYSGLTDAEIRQVDRFVRSNTLDKFGPVRTVKPELVFEIAFETIQRSTRHKAGLAVRFPRIARPRPDKSAQDADTLGMLKELLDHLEAK